MFVFIGTSSNGNVYFYNLRGTMQVLILFWFLVSIAEEGMNQVWSELFLTHWGNGCLSV